MSDSTSSHPWMTRQDRTWIGTRIRANTSVLAAGCVRRPASALARPQPGDAEHWLRNGGATALESWGIPPDTPPGDWPALLPIVWRYWQRIAGHVAPKHRAGRLKQWLNLLRRRFPEAEQAYQEVRTQTDQREITLWVQALARRQEWAGL